MTRFVSPDLSGLVPPPAVETLDFEAILAARKTDLAARATAAGLTDLPEVLQLDSEPLVLLEQTDSYFELQVRQRVNDAVKACMIATATGTDLDHLAATFYGVQRLTITPADNTTVPPTPAVMEDDGTFRARALLSMEARSTAGPEGAYIYFSLQADPNVLDAACYSEDDAAIYANGVFVRAPEVLVVVLSRVGSGVPDTAMITTVTNALSAEEVRPIGDKVTVERASVINYSVQGVLKYAPGADAAAMVAEATARVQSYADARHRIGKIVQRFGLAAGLKVTDAEEVQLTVLDHNGNPTTQDIDPGSKGAAYCTSISITAQTEADSWRP